MKSVELLLENGDQFLFPKIGSYKELITTYAPGKEFGRSIISVSAIDPCIPEDWEAFEPMKAYAGKLTYLKLKFMIEHFDFSKLNYKENYPYAGSSSGPVYWDDVAQTFKTCRYYIMPKGSFYIFVGWSDESGKKPDISKQEVKIKRYHTQEYQEINYIAGFLI